MASPQAYLTALEHLRIVIYFNVASATVLIFDYFLTFPREISLVWSARWTPTKVIFLLSRYLPFFDVGFFMYSHFQASDVETCHRVVTATSWWFWVGTALCGVILSVRTWAVWNRGWPLGIALALLLAVGWIPGIPIILIFNKSLDFAVVESPPLLGCLMIKGSNIAYICWILLLVNEFGLFFLMLLKAIRCYKNGGMSGLSLVVYRDGLLYYLILFVFAFANVVIMGTISPDLKSVLVLTERVIHPILACRVILDMREYITTPHINTKLPVQVAAVPAAISSSLQGSTLKGKGSVEEVGSNSNSSLWKP